MAAPSERPLFSMKPALIIALTQILMLLLMLPLLLWFIPKIRRLTMSDEDKLNEISWKLSAELREYVDARKNFAYLRKNGHLSAAETDHQLALDQVLAMKCDNEDVRRYFELIVNEQINLEKTK